MGTPLRVLIVEDSQDDALLVLRELRRGGYDPSDRRVDTARTLNEALEEQEWDLIICDYTLPWLNATTALQTMQDKGLDIPFIIVTGSIEDREAVAAMKSGAHDYIMKNNMARLNAAIQRETQEAGVRRQRRRAEEALKASEERYREFIAQSTEGIWRFDLEPIPIDRSENQIVEHFYRCAYLTVCNDAMARLYGRSRADEMLGTRPDDLMMRSDPQTVEHLHEFVRLGFRLTDAESQELDSQGRSRYFLNNLTGVIKEGKLTGLWGTQRDITDFKSLEVQFRQAQKMEAVGRLAGGVAHDFNNLLTVIMGYSDILLSRAPKDEPTRLALLEIRKSGERAAMLTRQLLAFSRKQVLRSVLLDLNTIVTEMEHMLRRLIGEDVELATALDPDLGSVKADPGQVEQVIMNLVINARDAMPTGGKLTLETHNVCLDENYQHEHPEVQPGYYALLAVSDTGCGMDENVRIHIFEPFFTTKEAGKGTGLGLATVYGIVKQSGGHIWLYTEPGKGTTFKIYLPLSDQQGYSARSTVEFKIPEGSETVLLVEDEDGVRSLAQLILKTNGYKVLEASTSQEAITIAEQHQGPVHLLLTDVVLPQMSGRLLADHVTSLRPDIKILYISGYTDDAVVRHGVLDTGMAFLQKPFTPASLAQRVRDVLDAD